MPINEDVARQNYEEYADARDKGHLKFLEKVDRCERYVRGSQWLESVAARLESQGKPHLTINRTLSALLTIFGSQLDNRADITFRPSKNGVQETADALAKVYINIANNNQLDWLESEVFEDGMIRSRGFYDCRIGFKDQMLGEVELSRLNSRNVVLDPEAEEYDPDKWAKVFVTKWLTPNEIAQLYNPDDAEYLRTRKKSDYMFGYDSLTDPTKDRSAFGGNSIWSPSGAGADKDYANRRCRVIERQSRENNYVQHFVDPVTGDTRPVPVNWDRKRIEAVAAASGVQLIKRYAPQLRWVVTADNVELFNEIHPCRHFTPVPFFPLLRDGHTIGLVETLLSPQDLLNKSLSQELHVVNTTANSGWKVKAGSLQNMDAEELEQRGAETGLVMELENVSDAEKIQPNQIPTGLDRLGFKADNFMKELSGASDSMRGFDRADVAAKAIMAKQQAGGVNLAKAFDNLTRTRHLLARNILDLVQTYYTEERVLNITGRDLTAEPETLVVNQVTPEGQVLNDLTLGEYSVVVTTVPARNTFEDSQFREAIELRKLGIMIPDDVIIEHSHLSRKAEIAKRMKEIAGGGEPTAAQQQMMQMEAQLKDLEMQEKAAEVQKKKADAALQMVRARVEAQQASQGGDENAKAAAELEVKREEIAAQIALQREKQLADIQMRRELMAAELQMRREQMAEESAMRKTEAIFRMKMERSAAAREKPSEQETA